MFRALLCPSSGAQELYGWLRRVVHNTLVYRSLVWCGAVGYESGLRATSRNPDAPVEQHPTTQTRQSSNIAQLGHITYSPASDQRPVNQKCYVPHVATICTILELLMMGIIVPETCWADSKFAIKLFCCIQLAFIPRSNDNAWSNSHQVDYSIYSASVRVTECTLPDVLLIKQQFVITQTMHKTQDSCVTRTVGLQTHSVKICPQKIWQLQSYWP
jgi:hypothetical protein